MEAARSLPGRVRNLSRRLSNQEVERRIFRIQAALSRLRPRLDPCTLCPRRCESHRSSGETGECGIDANLRIASVARHTGEEPPISGQLGAINVFFSGCNLHCLHCQNWPLSQQRVGRNVSPAELADRILKKWRKGAHTLGWVTPTPQIVGALEAYKICLEVGCNLPLVYNSGGYDDVEVIRLLAGIMDLWLPDAKTSRPGWALEIHGVRNYPLRNCEALKAMVDLVEAGQARAVIVRHMILPDGLRDSFTVLTRLWETFGNSIHLSLMSQYFPTYRTEGHEILGRKITSKEYDGVVAFARDLGFRKGWVQSMNTEEGISQNCLI